MEVIDVASSDVEKEDDSCTELQAVNLRHICVLSIKYLQRGEWLLSAAGFCDRGNACPVATGSSSSLSSQATVGMGE